MKHPIEYLNEYDKKIEQGIDVEELKRVRRKIYRFKDYEITNEEFILKHTLLNCIKELIND